MAGFLQLEGIEGESADDKHKKWSDIESFSTGVDRPGGVIKGSGGAGGGSDAVYRGMNVTMGIDSSTPKVVLFCNKGKMIPKAKVELTRTNRDGGREVYFTAEMENVYVTNVSFGGATQGDHPATVDVTLSPEVYKWEYTPTEAGKKGGKVAMGWNVLEGKEA